MSMLIGEWNTRMCPLILVLWSGMATIEASGINPFSGLQKPGSVDTERLVAERTRAERPSGLSGMLISEMTLRGIVISPSSSFAILEGKDHSTYLVRTGTRLSDGHVARISRSGIYFKPDPDGSALLPIVFKRLVPEVAP